MTEFRFRLVVGWLSAAIILALIPWSSALAESPMDEEFPWPRIPDPGELNELPEIGDPVENYLHLPPPRPPGEVREIAISQTQVCALIQAGFVFCWPLQEDTVVMEPPRELFVTITAGDHHFCGLDTTSRPICWGDNAANQLEAPREVLLSISAGSTHTCALDAAGQPICWGRLDVDHQRPPSEPFHHIDAGLNHTCATGPWEPSLCWGTNAWIDKPFREAISQLSVSSDTVCALDATNRPICETSGAPLDPPSPLAVDLAVGRSFVCTLDPNGDLQCDGPNAPDLPPSPPISIGIEASEEILCAVTAWEGLHCWDDSGIILGH